MLYEGIQISTKQVSQPHTIPAPIGGLNGRDSLANMAETDAYYMDNIIPGTSTCYAREGCEIWQDPVGAPVESLEVFASGEEQIILAFAGTNIWNVTAKGIKVNMVNSLASAQTVATMFSTVADGNQFLIITTGADVPMFYDGTVIADLAFTGLLDPAEKINFVESYMGRLFWGVEDKLGFYYLPPGQISGAMEWFDLGQATKLGGYLQAIATYSDDSGDGPDDYIVFITSRGEYLMFRGLDPGDAEAWEIVGRFRGAEPIGRKCVANYAGDLLVITTEGVHQFSQIRKLGDTRYEAVALTSKLGDILLKHNVNRDIWGWHMQLYPKAGLLFVSAPDSNNPTGVYHQFAMNTVTQSWTKFNSREWDCVCMCMSNKRIYFGRWDGSVRIVGGLYDNLKPIHLACKQAYNYFKTPKHKHFKWAQFLLKSDAPLEIASRLSVDFMENVPVVPPSAIGEGAGAEWDIAFWDEAVWAIGPYTQRWIAPYGNYGVAASHWLQADVGGATFEWFSTEHVYEEAEGLL